MQVAGDDLELLLSHEGKADEWQQLLHLIKVPAGLLCPGHAGCEEAALRTRLQSRALLHSQVVTDVLRAAVSACVMPAALVPTLHAAHITVVATNVNHNKSM